MYRKSNDITSEELFEHFKHLSRYQSGPGNDVNEFVSNVDKNDDEEPTSLFEELDIPITCDEVLSA